MWTVFRDRMVFFGFYERDFSAYTYALLLVLLFGGHLFTITKDTSIKPLSLACGVGIILLFSYPFLSHDFFNYIFDAKIFTYYGLNPYSHAPAFFYQDEWLRFMHWTHRSYPYGPTFLPITLVPSFFAAGKFVLNFFFFKLLFVAAYILSVFLLQKIDRKSALIFATHPFILIEGVINAHNDLISVALALIGIYFVWSKRQKMSWVFFLLSAGIKYLTLPTLILTKGKNWQTVLSFMSTLLLLIYLFITAKQPWYFLVLFIYLPWYRDWIVRLWPFFLGLLFSYYPFIRFGDWTKELLSMREWIMWIGMFGAGAQVIMNIIRSTNKTRIIGKNNS